MGNSRWRLETSPHRDDYPEDVIRRTAEQVEAVRLAYPFASLDWLQMPTTRLDTMPLNDLVNRLREVVVRVRPEVVYVPNPSDAHSDHWVTGRAALAVLKSFYLRSLGVRRVLVCEVISETDAAPPFFSRPFQPNAFVDILRGAKMFHTVGGIADVWMQKVVLDFVRLPLCAPEIVAHISDEFPFASRALPPHRIGRHILVQELVRVEFRTVSWQEEKGDLPLVLCRPALHSGSPLHRMPIDNKEGLPSGVADQPPQEQHTHGGREAPFENHQCQPPSVGDGRDHVTTKSPSCAGHDGCLATATPGAPRVMIRAPARLVAPKDRCLLPTSQPPDRWIVFLQPATHRHGVSLVGAAQRVLGRKASTPEAATHRPNRQPRPVALRKEIPHGLAGPERKGQRELIRTAVGDQPYDRGRLVGLQRQHLWPAPRPRTERPRPPYSPTAMPPVYGASGNPKDPCCLRLRHAPNNGLNNALAQAILHLGGQTASVQMLHALY